MNRFINVNTLPGHAPQALPSPMFSGARGLAWLLLGAVCAGAVGALGWTLLFIPTLALCFGALLCVSGARGGWLIPMLLTAVLAVTVSYVYQGTSLAWLALLYWPLIAAQYALDRQRMPFAVTVAALSVLTLLLSLAALLAATRALGQSPPAAAVSALEGYLAANPNRNRILLTAYQFGVARLRDANPGGLQLGSYIFLAPSVQSELTKSLLATAEETLAAGLPGQAVAGSLLTGLLAASLPRWAYLRDPSVTAPPPAPPLKDWTLRAVPGIQPVFLGFIALTVLSLFTGGTLARVTAIVNSAAGLAFVVQGAAAADWWLRRRSAPRGLRAALILALYVFLGFVLQLIGVADLCFNRKRSEDILILAARRLPRDGKDGKDGKDGDGNGPRVTRMSIDEFIHKLEDLRDSLSDAQKDKDEHGAQDARRRIGKGISDEPGEYGQTDGRKDTEQDTDDPRDPHNDAKHNNGEDGEDAP